MKTKVGRLLCLFAVLGLVVFYVVCHSPVCHARVTATRSNLKTVHSALLKFQHDNNRFPSQEEGLLALLEKPNDVNHWQEGGYLEDPRIVTDGWGNNLVYIFLSGNDPAFVLLSFGGDGVSGGYMLDKDIFSTDTY